MKKNGFTLLELLVVVAIMCILAALLTPLAVKSIEDKKMKEASGTTIDGESISLAGGSPLILRVANREFFINEESGNLVALPPPAPQSMISLKTVDVDGKLEPILVYESVGSDKKTYRIVKKSTRDGINIVLQPVPPR